MNLQAEREAPVRFGHRGKRVLLEAVGVLITGGLLALLANALSPRGLNLRRDYFPDLSPASATTTASTGALTTNPLPANIAMASAPATNAPAATNAVEARLRAHGLQYIEQADVVALFHDPKTAQGLFVFVDARNDELYQEGHIPGALQMDYYHFEKYLPAVLAACQVAEKIVVYCTGGECEDSELAAALLGKVVPREKLFVYTGGFTEWSASGQPIEVGNRDSGVLKQTKP